MIPYFALIFIPLFLQVYLKVSGSRIRVGHRSCIRAENIALPVFFILFALMLALRNETVGSDLQAYKAIFYAIGSGRVFQPWYGVTEPLFLLYNWIIYNCISTNYQVFLAITAIVTLWPIAYVYNQDKSQGYVKIAVFVGMSTFIMLFSGIRQGMAMSAGLLAYQALKEKKTRWFMVWTAAAMLLHHTGFMVLLLYPLYRIRLHRRDLFWLLPCFGLVLLFGRTVYSWLSSLLGRFNSKYGGLAGSTGAYGSFLLFTLFMAFCYMIEDETRMDDEAFALRSILTFAAGIQSLASLHPLAMRLNYYFILLIPMALGRSIQHARPKYAQVAKLAEFVIAAYFTLYFVYDTYCSYVTGLGSLNSVPYIPFWRG